MAGDGTGAPTEKAASAGVVLASVLVFVAAFLVVLLVVTLALAAVEPVVELVYEHRLQPGENWGPAWQARWGLPLVGVAAAAIAGGVVYRMSREEYPGPGWRLSLSIAAGIALPIVAFLAFRWLVDRLGVPPEVIGGHRGALEAWMTTG
jgi:ABC-type Fe3+ transport system permease subunit